VTWAATCCARADWIEEYVSEVVIERLSRPDAVELLVDRDRPDAGKLREEATALRVRIEETIVGFAELDVPAASTKATLETLKARLAEMEGSRPTRAGRRSSATW